MFVNNAENLNFYTDSIIPFVLFEKKAKTNSVFL